MADAKVTQDGLIYTLSSNGSYYSVKAESTSITTANILSEISGILVTTISENAFYNCLELTSITIPNSVTSIGNSAFGWCSSLTSINIPDSVTSIGDDTFSGCFSLTSITIPNGVTSIGNGAFSQCELLTSVTIGNGVISIGDGAFYNCFSLTSITIDPDNTVYKSDENCLIEISTNKLIRGCNTSIIPNYVTEISDYAFEGSGLTSITIPDSVTSIGFGVFEYCSGLTSVTIGNSVTSIGDYTFSGCESLTNIAIPDSVTSIGNHAFAYCTSLTSINIPDSVTSIGDNAFEDCSALTLINIPDSVSSIGSGAFVNCFALTNITIPDGVTSIENNVFNNCYGLTSIIIPDSVTSIGELAFCYCFSLISVTIGNNVTSIGDGAFGGCSELTDFTLNSTTAIPEAIDVFSECDALTEVKYTQAGVYNEGETWCGKTLVYFAPPEQEIIQNGLIYTISSDRSYYSVKANDTSITGNIVIEDEISGVPVEIIETNGFRNCNSMTSITLNENLKIINSSAFYGTNISGTVIIPNNVVTIANYAFYNCKSLTGITLGTSLVTIGDYAFYNCTAVESINDFPSTLTKIGTYSFYGLSKCNKPSVVIPDSVTTVGGFAFYNWMKLTSLYISKNCSVFGSGNTSSYANSLATLTVGSGNAYYKTDKNCLIEISTNRCVGSAKQWSIPNYVTSISSYCFQCKTPSVATPVIPETCTSIEGMAFYSSGISGVIHIPKSVTNISSGNFIGGSCSSYITGLTVDPQNTVYHSETNCIIETAKNKLIAGCKNSTIPGYITEIAGSAFYVNYSLASIKIPKSCKIIGSYAFYLCNKLKEIRIPISVTSIGNYAFQSCTALTTFIIESKYTIPSGTGVLASCSKLSNVYFTDKNGAYVEGESWNSRTLSYYPPKVTFNNITVKTLSVTEKTIIL